MSEIENLVTRTGLEAWHAASFITGVAHGGNVGGIADRSSHARDLYVPSLPATLDSSFLNDQPAVIFAGTENAYIVAMPGAYRHVFVVAGYEGATFDVSNPGLLCGQTGEFLLVGEGGTTNFVDYSGTLGNYIYRKLDVVKPNADAVASVGGTVAIFEVLLPANVTFATIRVGGTGLVGSWVGPWLEQMIYSRPLSDNERHDIYEYFACKYRLWKEVASGLHVFPFQPNWGQPLSHSKRVLSSSAVSGAYKARSKSTQKKGIQPSFESRITEEYDTAVAFNDEHYPGSTFIWKDDSFSPARETEMRFISDVQMTRSEDFNDKDYNFQAIEV